MKNKYLLIAAITAIFLLGCAPMPPLNFSVPNAAASPKKIDAELKSLTVTIAQANEKSGVLDFLSVNVRAGNPALGEVMVPQLWQTSLVEALNKMAIFQDDAIKKVSLSVKIVKFNTLSAGLSFITESSALYEIIDRKTGDIVFSQVISASGKSPEDAAFDGHIRRQESINQSVQKNLSQFLIILERVDI